jgi:hypothetical protein
VPSIRPRVEITDVRAAPAAAVDGAAPSSAHPPVAGAAAGSETLAELIVRLEREHKDNPLQMDEAVRLALLYLATGQDAKAGALSSGLDPLRGDLASALIQVVVASREPLQKFGSPAPSALAAADHLRLILSQRSPVMIPKVALVTGVQSFGAYQAVNPPRFPAGQPVHVFLYTEVANFRAEPLSDGRLQTVLSEKVEIFDRDGKVIWEQNHATIRDVVSTPRRDFFIPLEIKLPAGTPAGEYVLKVTIEDKIGATTDQRRVTFTIGNP